MLVTKYLFLIAVLFSSLSFSHGNFGGHHELTTRIMNTPPLTWAHEDAGVEYDPSMLKFGALPNHMRYALGSTHNGSDCELILMVAAGALAEQPHEEGMAHLLEHLVFRANRFGDSSLYDLITESIYGKGAVEAQGLTMSGVTFYSFSMKTCSEKNRAIKALADIAYRTSFTEEHLTLEKRSVDSEEAAIVEGNFRDKDSSSRLHYLRRLTHVLDEMWPTANISNVIGTKRVRDKFTIEGVERFYKKWYDPRRMAIAFVGPDAHHEEALSLIRNEFAPFVVETPLPDMPARVVVRDESKDVAVVDGVKLLHHHEILLSDMSSPFAVRRFDEVSRREAVLYDVVANALQQKLWKERVAQDLLHTTVSFVRSEEGAPKLELQMVLPGDFINRGQLERTLSIINSFDVDQFENSLDLAKRLAKSNALVTNRVLKNHSKTNLKNAIVDSFSHMDVHLTEVPRWIDEELARIDAEHCVVALQQSWNQRVRDNRIMLTSGRPSSHDKAVLLATLADVDRKIRVSPFVHDRPGDFTFSQPEELDSIPLQLKKTADGKHVFLLKNGLQVWSSPEASGDRVRVFIVLGDVGHESDDRVQYQALASIAVSGCKGFCGDEIARLLPKVSVDIFPMRGGLIFSGSAAKEDVPSVMQLVHAYITEPNFWDDDSRKRKQFIDEIRSSNFIPGSHVMELLCQIGDFGFVKANTASDADLESIFDANQLRRQMQKLRCIGITKLGFAGNIDITDAIASFAQIFIDIPWASSKPLETRGMKCGLTKTARCLDAECPTAKLILSYPVDKTMTRGRLIDYDALAILLEKSIFQKLRIEHGEGYAPQVHIVDYSGLAYSTFVVELNVSQNAAHQMAVLVKSLATDLGNQIRCNGCNVPLAQVGARYENENTGIISFLMDRPHEVTKEEVSNKQVFSDAKTLACLADSIFVVARVNTALLFPQ